MPRSFPSAGSNSTVGIVGAALSLPWQPEDALSVLRAPSDVCTVSHAVWSARLALRLAVSALREVM